MPAVASSQSTITYRDDVIFLRNSPKNRILKQNEFEEEIVSTSNLLDILIDFQIEEIIEVDNNSLTDELTTSLGNQN